MLNIISIDFPNCGNIVDQYRSSTNIFYNDVRLKMYTVKTTQN